MGEVASFIRLEQVDVEQRMLNEGKAALLVAIDKYVIRQMACFCSSLLLDELRTPVNAAYSSI